MQAPVQVSFKGFPGSTGATFIDLLVGDRIATPPEHREQWTEKLLLLPYFYHVNGHWRRFHAPPAKPDADRVVFEERGRQVRIPEHSVLLCSFNRQVPFAATLKYTCVNWSGRVPGDSALTCGGFVSWDGCGKQVKFEPDSWAAWMKVLQAVPGEARCTAPSSTYALANAVHRLTPAL